MINPTNDKEIYFSKDVFKQVAERQGVSIKVVEKAFKTFLKYYKKQLEEGDGIIYELPYLGEMILSKTDANKELEKYRRRYYREKDPKEQERLRKVVDNYRIRLKKIKIEVEKIKRHKGYLRKEVRQKMIQRKMSMTTPDNIRKRSLLMGHSLEESMKKQNEYAYKHYEKLKIQ